MSSSSRYPSILFQYTGSEQNITVSKGRYLFECWGAKGYSGSQNGIGGNGAYTQGYINIKTDTTFYVYVGSSGSCGSKTFNGGGESEGTGGGATDFRLINGSWDSFESLKSRIMVAAGGGGTDWNDEAGAGGILEGFSSKVGKGKGGNQTSGGDGFYPGEFGKGGGYSLNPNNGGGGGGYYGGGSSSDEFNYGGGGGSSFISGYKDCNAISERSTEEKIIHTNTPNHYSGHIFYPSLIIPGNEQIPNIQDSPLIKYTGEAFAKISFISSIQMQTCTKTSLLHMLKLQIYIFIIMC